MFSKSPLQDIQINWRWSLSEANKVFLRSAFILKQVIKIAQALSQFPDGYSSAQFFCKLQAQLDGLTERHIKQSCLSELSDTPCCHLFMPLSDLLKTSTLEPATEKPHLYFKYSLVSKQSFSQRQLIVPVNSVT